MGTAHLLGTLKRIAQNLVELASIGYGGHPKTVTQNKGGECATLLPQIFLRDMFIR